MFFKLVLCSYTFIFTLLQLLHHFLLLVCETQNSWAPFTPNILGGWLCNEAKLIQELQDRIHAKQKHCTTLQLGKL